MSAGTAHGLVIFDCLQSTVVSSKCTLNAQGQYERYYDFCTFFERLKIHSSRNIKKPFLNFPDIANADDNPMSRRKSLKKSLRESFRRLRKGRSQRNIDKKKNTTGNTTSDPIKKELPKYRYIFEINPNFDLINHNSNLHLFHLLSFNFVSSFNLQPSRITNWRQSSS